MNIQVKVLKAFSFLNGGEQVGSHTFVKTTRHTLGEIPKDFRSLSDASLQGMKNKYPSVRRDTDEELAEKAMTMLPTTDGDVAQPELPPSVKAFWINAFRCKARKNTFLSRRRGNRYYMSIRVAMIVVAVGTALMPLNAINKESTSNAWWQEDDKIWSNMSHHDQHETLDCEKRRYFTIVAYNGVLAFFWADHLGAFLVRNLYYFDWSHLARVFSFLLGEDDGKGGHKIDANDHITTIEELIFWHAILKRVVDEMNQYVNEWLISWALHMLLLHAFFLSGAFLVVSHTNPLDLPRNPCQLSP